MRRNVGMGLQDFSKIIERGLFYVDKSLFISEWWDRGDDVTLITRPRRFGKTLNISMLDYFFSINHEGSASLFKDLNIWKNERFRALQGTFPVIFLSFAGVKSSNFNDSIFGIKYQIIQLFRKFSFLGECDGLLEADQKEFKKYLEGMSDTEAVYSLNFLSSMLEKYYHKKVLIFLDEYDTPLQEAWTFGYWDEMVQFIRMLFNNTFKTNLSLDRGLMTGITRISKESIFSDLNNLTVVTTTSEEYATCFGFTEKEVFDAMDEQGLNPGKKKAVKGWYDGFIFGKTKDIYNPWSVAMYLKTGEFDTYWANTSGNALVDKLVREGDPKLKSDFELLLNGGEIHAKIDEQIVFTQLNDSDNNNAIWSLLMAAGYLKADLMTKKNGGGSELERIYRLSFTNLEVRLMFNQLISRWFQGGHEMTGFVSALFKGDVDEMNNYMNDIALNTFSSFDTGNKPSRNAPERFYHGFVLGLIADKHGSHMVKSNRESGYGRYDVVMEPKDADGTAVIMEFKVKNKRKGEETLSDTAAAALQQIEDRRYDADLLKRGIKAENILKYGFAFEGRECLIVKG